MNKIGILLALFTITLDQLSKYAITKYLLASVTVNSFFNLSLTYNQGISFGLFKHLEHSNYIFAALSIVITGLLYSWLKQASKIQEATALGLIIGGALGNVIDRFCYPGVVDFLEFHWKEYYWPSFNIADSAIFLGVCILLIFSVNLSKRAKK